MTDDQKRAVAIVLSGERDGLDAAAVNGAIHCFLVFFADSEPYFDADQFAEACGGLRDKDYTEGASALCPYCGKVGAWTPLHFQKCEERHSQAPYGGRYRE